MPYELVISREALRVLRSLPRNRRETVVAKIEEIAADPRGSHPQATSLKGSDAFRLRIGDWRVLYEIDHRNRRMIVTAIAHRREAYR
jgi:mRNA interferase RelE/StbE